MNVGTRFTPREVSCACGSMTAIVLEGMNIENLRCWLCPKDEPKRPTLRLVKS